MASYRIEFAKSAVKDLRGIDRKAVPRILVAVEALADDPRPPRSKKLVGSRNTYRIRIGDYRVIYKIHDGQLSIDVIRIRKRGEVYR